jgi:hypothetical protein
VGRRARGPLSLPFSFLHAAPSRPPPSHFPRLFSLTCPPIWRSRRRLTPLCSTSTPELELPSFSTAYTPASSAPATGDPSSSLVPARASPLSAIIGEHDHTLSLHSNGLTPHLPRHCRATPSMSSATGAASPPLNAAARSILHRIHAAPPLR